MPIQMKAKETLQSIGSRKDTYRYVVAIPSVDIKKKGAQRNGS